MQFSDKEENYRLILIFGPPLRTINRGKDLAEWKNGATFVPGKLAEWSIAAVLKTVEPQGSGGSNPSLSAKKKRKLSCSFLFFYLGLFVDCSEVCESFCAYVEQQVYRREIVYKLKAVAKCLNVCFVFYLWYFSVFTEDVAVVVFVF